jgi:hypothetical protein
MMPPPRGLDPNRVTYTPLSELTTASEKARRDAPAVAVCEVWDPGLDQLARLASSDEPTPQRRRVKALRWLNPRLRPSAGRSPPVRQPQGSAGGGQSPASAGIAGRCGLAASDTLGHESGSGDDSRRRAGLPSTPGSSETPGDAVVGGLGRGANDTAGRAVYRVLVTVGVLLEVLGTNAQRMKSDSWQLEACECDRDPRGVVLRRAP